MATEHIVALLIAERDKLNRAIEALGVPTAKRRGRPAKDAQPAAIAPAAEGVAPNRKRTLSPAKRKAHSERMKAYWAARRKMKS
jgi:hypothetical protein